ncbi:helix-turn-helix transcriptional regulator [Kineobactrum salinum]|uniref:Helix-turn-helix transcriptional regulator n=1 Tax=Kineobactrum salinum TaxID=2708301 RepID=A0A6C0U1V6_9GAMM|nr:helix-turn-helix transcriptional regulator [Kineobactrum salinum]QIB66122.1 helix-turn-helix transcriptional regulator [Kineobactrum salinum]
MSKIHDQLKTRRKAIGLKQEDMELRVGMSRQQYQRLESKGNPRLDTLELVAKGLKMELMLIPQEKLRDVEDFLAGKKKIGGGLTLTARGSVVKPSPEDNPWGDLLEGDDD